MRQREHFQILEICLALSRKFQVRHYRQLPAVKVHKMQSSRLLLVPNKNLCCKGIHSGAVRVGRGNLLTESDTQNLKLCIVCKYLKICPGKISSS